MPSVVGASAESLGFPKCPILAEIALDLSILAERDFIVMLSFGKRLKYLSPATRSFFYEVPRCLFTEGRHLQGNINKSC